LVKSKKVCLIIQYSINIIQVPFVEDLSKSKVRPAVYLADSSRKYQTVLACFVTSNLDEFEDGDTLLENFAKYNLLVPSLIKVSKIFTIPKNDVKYEISLIENGSELEMQIKERLKNIFDLY
jgi:PemK-like, MazF-like toxin of type II toxin-antitoxin system